MNFRKFLCRFFHRWHWFHQVVKCEQFDPQPIPPIPPTPPEPPQPPPPIEYISAKVCTASGLLPNQYCPNTKDMQFVKGKEPTTVCTTHTQPPKPQRPSMFIGTSVYELMEFADAVISWFLEELYKIGANCTEIFASYTWSAGAKLQPYLKIGDLYDLTAPNSKYWAKLSMIMTKCSELDLTLIIRLFDYCSVKDEDYYKLYCWHSNLQKRGWQAARKAWGGFYGDKPKEYYAQYIEQICILAKKTKCSVQFEGVNEADYKPSQGEVEGWIKRTLPETNWQQTLTPNEKDIVTIHSDKIILKFHEWLLQELDKYGYLLQYISTNAKYKQTINWAIQQGIFYEQHGCNSPESVNEVYLKYGFTHAVPNGDGPDQDARGRQGDKPEKREPSVAQGTTIGKFLKDKKAKTYLYFNRATEQVSPFDLKRAKFDVVEAIVKAAI